MMFCLENIIQWRKVDKLEMTTDKLEMTTMTIFFYKTYISRFLQVMLQVYHELKSIVHCIAELVKY